MWMCVCLTVTSHAFQADSICSLRLMMLHQFSPCNMFSSMSTDKRYLRLSFLLYAHAQCVFNSIQFIHSFIELLILVYTHVCARIKYKCSLWLFNVNTFQYYGPVDLCGFFLRSVIAFHATLCCFTAFLCSQFRTIQIYIYSYMYRM